MAVKWHRMHCILTLEMFTLHINNSHKKPFTKHTCCAHKLCIGDVMTFMLNCYAFSLKAKFALELKV